MNLIFWVRATGILLLVLIQTLRVLQTTYLPHPHVPNPYPSVHCLKTPAKTVPPTPGTALQQKVESNLEKSLGNSLNIHLQQQMASFQASLLEAFQSHKWLKPRGTNFQKASGGGSDLGFKAWNLSSCCKSGPTPSKTTSDYLKILNRWKWTMVLHFHLSSVLIII